MTMSTLEISQYKPYSTKRTGCVFPEWKIFFEETHLATVYDYEIASKMVSMLNGAYQLGYSQCQIRQQLDDIV